MACIVSFIVPFYNGVSTIARCLDSIYSIELKEDEYEVIIIDDCSPTRADLVLTKYTTCHSNLIIIRHAINLCQGGAKNTGIRISRGRYIVFADQDDYIIPDNLLVAIKKATINECDLCACRFYIRNLDGSVIEEGGRSTNEINTNGKDYCEHYFDTARCLAPWSYLYRRDYLISMSHPMEENVLMEDSDWVAWHLFFAPKVFYLPIPIYCWVMNSSSITHGATFRHKADYVKFGYRKIRDSQAFRAYSKQFALVMCNDGRYNIENVFKKLWKTDDYFQFYRHVGKDVLNAIQQMEWSKRTRFMIRYPRVTSLLLSIIGPIKKSLRSLIH